MEFENYERNDLYGDPGARRVLRRTGIPRLPRKPGRETWPALSLRGLSPRLIAPASSPPRVLVRCKAGPVEAHRARNSFLLPLTWSRAVQTRAERRIRGLWSVDANRLRRPRAEDRGPEGAADRSRKRPRRLRSSAARAFSARAQLGHAAAALGVRRWRVLCLNGCGGPSEAAFHRICSGLEAAWMSYSFP